jgi:hypothetical protein
MHALGRSFNTYAVADDVYVSLKDAGGVAFLCVNAAGDTWTLTEAKDAAGTGAQVLATMTQFHVQATVSAAWVKVTQAAASTIVTTASQDVMLVEVEDAELSDTYDYVKLTSTGAGTVVAILRDLNVQRAPANLANVGA